MRAGRWVFVLGLVLAVAGAGCMDAADSSSNASEGDEEDESNLPSGDDADDAEGPPSEDGEDEPPTEPREPPDVRLEELVGGLELPTLVTSAEDGTGRLFVLEQAGTIYVIGDGELAPEPYLDLTDRTKAEGERGLLGLAFDPSFADNGRLVVSYTDDSGGDSVLEAFTVDEPESGRPSGEGTQLLSVEQPYGNHNGGHLAFGPDGYLYYGLGDGGSGGDPEGNGQDPTTLLGSLLRLDVSGEEAKAPADNPFVDDEGDDLVWAYGLRNPWRFSFDRETGDLFIGDVGQESWEEIDHQPAGSEGGENYGWNVWEGNHTYQGEATREGSTFPILEYPREDGRCSVTGGYVYRGPVIDELQGFYLYADFCAGTIWAAQETVDGWRSEVLLETEHQITSFGEDEAGEVYVVARGGSVHRIVPG